MAESPQEMGLIHLPPRELQLLPMWTEMLVLSMVVPVWGCAVMHLMVVFTEGIGLSVQHALSLPDLAPPCPLGPVLPGT